MTSIGVIASIVLMTATGALSGGASSLTGVDNPQRAKVNWALNCQGCHQADATGSAGGAPNMAGVISLFLGVEGGREYLARVPGVAHAPLDDSQLAEVLNWSLQVFDADHIPEDFVPYTAQEIGRLRRNPLISEASIMREELMSFFK